MKLVCTPSEEEEESEEGEDEGTLKQDESKRKRKPSENLLANANLYFLRERLFFHEHPHLSVALIYSFSR